MQVWNTVILIRPYKFAAELVSVSGEHQQVSQTTWGACMGSVTHSPGYLTEAMHCKTFRKISLGFRLKTYCNLPPMNFGTTIFFLQYSGVKGGNRIGSTERANCKSRYKSDPQSDFSKAVLDLMMQSRADQWKENKPLPWDLFYTTDVCRISAIDFSRETEMASATELHQKSLPL